MGKRTPNCDLRDMIMPRHTFSRRWIALPVIVLLTSYTEADAAAAVTHFGVWLRVSVQSWPHSLSTPSPLQPACIVSLIASPNLLFIPSPSTASGDHQSKFRLRQRDRQWIDLQVLVTRLDMLWAKLASFLLLLGRRSWSRIYGIRMRLVPFIFFVLDAWIK